MRFIFNFIFFGLLFYGLYLFLPEVFTWLSSWAEGFYSFVQSIYEQLTAHHDRATT